MPSNLSTQGSLRAKFLSPACERFDLPPNSVSFMTGAKCGHRPSPRLPQPLEVDISNLTGGSLPKANGKFVLDRLNYESLIKSDRYDSFSIANQYLESIKPVKAPRTITGKISAFNFLRDFERDCQYDLSFQNMNLEFFEALRKYAFETRMTKDKESNNVTATIEDNYFAKIVTVLKTFLNWALERG